jgi:hypothetical protein
MAAQIRVALLVDHHLELQWEGGVAVLQERAFSWGAPKNQLNLPSVSTMKFVHQHLGSDLHRYQRHS